MAHGARMDITPVINIANSLQASFEAINRLARDLPREQQEALEWETKRIFQAKAALMAWLDEGR